MMLQRVLLYTRFRCSIDIPIPNLFKVLALLNLQSYFFLIGVNDLQKVGFIECEVDHCQQVTQGMGSEKNTILKK